MAALQCTQVPTIGPTSPYEWYTLTVADSTADLEPYVSTISPMLTVHGHQSTLEK